MGIDEHKLSQLVASALTRNRTIEAFVNFLSWVKGYLRAEDRDSQSKPVPKAFVVDRHDGQFAVWRRYFQSQELCFAQRIWPEIFAGPLRCVTNHGGILELDGSNDS
jgi:hypothetical protein